MQVLSHHWSSSSNTSPKHLITPSSSRIPHILLVRLNRFSTFFPLDLRLCDSSPLYHSHFPCPLKLSLSLPTRKFSPLFFFHLRSFPQPSRDHILRDLAISQFVVFGCFVSSLLPRLILSLLYLLVDRVWSGFGSVSNSKVLSLQRFGG